MINNNSITTKKINFSNQDLKGIIEFSSSENPWILLLNPFGRIKEDFGVLSEWLLTNKFNVLRFDFRNNIGESSGGIEAISISDQILDIENAIKYIAKEYSTNNINIVAFSLSSRAVIEVARKNKVIKSIFLLSGVVDFSETLRIMKEKDEYVWEDKLENIKYKNPIDDFISNNIKSKYATVDGYRVGRKFMDDMVSKKYWSYISYKKAISEVSCNLVFIHGNKDERAPLQTLLKIYNHKLLKYNIGLYMNKHFGRFFKKPKKVYLEIVIGAGHEFNRYEYQRVAMRKIIKHLKGLNKDESDIREPEFVESIYKLLNEKYVLSKKNEIDISEYISDSDIKRMIKNILPRDTEFQKLIKIDNDIFTKLGERRCIKIFDKIICNNESFQKDFERNILYDVNLINKVLNNDNVQYCSLKLITIIEKALKADPDKLNEFLVSVDPNMLEKIGEVKILYLFHSYTNEKSTRYIPAYNDFLIRHGIIKLSSILTIEDLIPILARKFRNKYNIYTLNEIKSILHLRNIVGNERINSFFSEHKILDLNRITSLYEVSDIIEVNKLQNYFKEHKIVVDENMTIQELYYDQNIQKLLLDFMDENNIIVLLDTSVASLVEKVSNISNFFESNNISLNEEIDLNFFVNSVGKKAYEIFKKDYMIVSDGEVNSLLDLFRVSLDSLIKSLNFTLDAKLSVLSKENINVILKKYNLVDIQKIKTIEDYRNLLPIMDKKNYIMAYSHEEKSILNKFPAHGTIDESAGSSGFVSNWVRSSEEEDAIRSGLIFGLRYGYKDIDIALNGWTPGSWATGEKFCKLAEPFCIVKNCGTDIEKIISTLKYFGKDYKYLITGYPPFIIELIREGERLHFPWQDYKIDILSGGDGHIEEWREELQNVLGCTSRIFSAYGASDLDIGVSYETPFTVSLRNFLRICYFYTYDLVSDKELKTLTEYYNLDKIFSAVDKDYTKKVLKKFRVLDSRIPMIFQYDPTRYYIYNLESTFDKRIIREPVMSIANTHMHSPRVNYNIHDEGMKINFNDMMCNLRDVGVDEEMFTNEKLIHLPFLYIYGRSDGTVSIDGANIYPEDIEEIIFSERLIKNKIKSFKLSIIDGSDNKLHLRIQYELNENVASDDDFLFFLKKISLSKLMSLNEDFKKTYNDNPKEVLIELWSCQTGPFSKEKNSIKQGHIL